MNRLSFPAGLALRVSAVALLAGVAATAWAAPAAISELSGAPRLTAAMTSGAPETPKPSGPAPADTAKTPAADPLVLDEPFADTGIADLGLSVIDPEAWRPDHKASAAVAAPKAAAAGGKAPPKAAAGEKNVDPEPDAVTVPTQTGPSNDPLDRPRPAVAPAPAGGPTPAAGQTQQATDQPLSGEAAAIKAALDKLGAAPLKGPGIAEKRKERDAIAFFYAAHGFAPAWSENGKANAAVDPVLARLARADEDALTIPMPKALKTDGKPEEIADSDIALTEAVVAYARQASGSRIDPHTISPLMGRRPDLADPAEVIDALIAAGAQAGDTLAALNPSEPRYIALRNQLALLRGARKPAEPVKIAPGPSLKIGMHDPRVPALRTRLHLEPPIALDDQDTYDAELSDAVADFQRDHELPASGVLTKRTLAALTGGDAQPARQAASQAMIIANMEMWRWMPRDLGSERIEVNVPDYIVTVFHDGEPVAQNKVVVGKTDTPTPIFSNTMKYVIVNPVWNVPQSIIKKELLPKGGGSLSYLDGRGYKVSYRDGYPSVQQLSGPKNALGRIKFLFPNDYSVYLHDTPSKSLFATSRRAYSHGCVRVDQPFDFAESVLNDAVPEGGKVLWNQTRLQKLLGDKERYVNLPKPLPIHIEYFTASVDPDTDQLKLRPDIYGYSNAVAVALGLIKEAPQVVERKPKRVAERPQKAASVAVDAGDPR